MNLMVFLPMISLMLVAQSAAGQTEDWPFEVSRDTFDPASKLDLRSLNEPVAGETGWIQIDAQGDFVRGDGEPIRFWAVGTNVKESAPREQPGWDRQSLEHQARWFAKRGVNMVRTHAFINPPVDADLSSVNEAEIEWIWKVVGTMKKQGIYTTISPYWANNMKSDDAAWGTDWEGQHHGLLFFEKPLIAAYKEWLRYLFTTPTPYLNGKALAEEPAVAIFQIQNEDSLLFWTVNNLNEGQAQRLGLRFAQWAREHYGSLEAALLAWKGRRHANDDIAGGVLGFDNIWNLTDAAGMQDNPRLADQHRFWVETMRCFNASIQAFIREELGCPVLINAGNWKTADTVLLNDSERYSYTSNAVLAVNRYFNGIHDGPYRGWAIVADDFFTNRSVLGADALDFPINLKQVQGHPMLVTESTWVYPMETSFEAPLLIAAYSALNGVDGYYWFNSGVDDFEQPRSANGYLEDSQMMWLCMNPEMAGQWPAAALLFRQRHLKRAEPVVVEHRSLDAMWRRDPPLIAETSSFDPNRDRGTGADEDPEPDGGLSQVSPWAFFVGPVEVIYDSDPANSFVREDLDQHRAGGEAGMRVRSVTGELELNTAERWFRFDTATAKGMVTYRPRTEELQDLTLHHRGGPVSVAVVSMDGLPIRESNRVLVQVGTPSRPDGWQQEPAVREINKVEREGIRIVSVGKAPWRVQSSELDLVFHQMHFDKAHVLDMNGIAIAEAAMERVSDNTHLSFPRQSMYVLLER